MAKKKAKTLREIYDLAIDGKGITPEEAVVLADYTKRQVLLAGEAKKLAQETVSTSWVNEYPELKRKCNQYIGKLMKLNAEIRKPKQ